MNQKALKLRIIGFAASLILTLAAYLIIVYPELFHLKTQAALITIYTLAVFQSLLQLFCFIDIWGEKGPPWNLGVFISTISVVLIVILFSIWIMDTLNSNMMGT